MYGVFEHTIRERPLRLQVQAAFPINAGPCHSFTTDAREGASKRGLQKGDAIPLRLQIHASGPTPADCHTVMSLPSCPDSLHCLHHPLHLCKYLLQ